MPIGFPGLGRRRSQHLWDDTRSNPSNPGTTLSPLALRNRVVVLLRSSTLPKPLVELAENLDKIQQMMAELRSIDGHNLDLRGLERKLDRRLSVFRKVLQFAEAQVVDVEENTRRRNEQVAVTNAELHSRQDALGVAVEQQGSWFEQVEELRLRQETAVNDCRYIDGCESRLRLWEELITAREEKAGMPAEVINRGNDVVEFAGAWPPPPPYMEQFKYTAWFETYSYMTFLTRWCAFSSWSCMLDIAGRACDMAAN